MQTRVVRLLLIGLGVRCLVGCSVPEAAATPGKEVRQSARDPKREPSVADRRRLRIQKQILSDLRALKQARDTPSGNTESASAEPAQPAAYKLLIFGGPTHEVYLGCLCEGQE